MKKNNYVVKKSNTVYQYFYKNPLGLVNDVLDNDMGADRIEIERISNGTTRGLAIRTEKGTELESIITDRTVIWDESDDSDDNGLYELIITPTMNRCYNRLQRYFALNDIDDGLTLLIHEHSKNDYIQESLMKLKVYMPIWDMLEGMKKLLLINHYDD